MEGRSFQLERISTLWAELEPLAAAHLAEAGGKLPLKLDQVTYTAMEAAGVHRFDTVRLNGELIGYCSTLISTAFHDGARVAHEDGIYVLPRHRGWTGGDLEHWVDTMLATNGVLRSYRERLIPIEATADRALRRGPVGYHPSSVLFVRHLETASP